MAVAHCPFGPAVAVSGGKYLGAWLTCAARDALGHGARWERATLDDTALYTWQTSTGALDKQSRKLAQHR
eukprot:4131455-Lingulodinium_polyedra.AAC.1